jgi:serine/threonine-protein kinase
MMIGVRVDGRYEVINVLGGGAFGQTFLARDTKRPGHPFCVIKQLRYSHSNPAALEHARRLFKKEAEILEKLGHHDQIPTLLADIEEQQEFYLVEQFVPGQPLSQEIVPGLLWDEQQVIDLLQEVLPILVFVHGQSVIHRDIKPANLMRRQADGKIVLIDFGAVKELGTQIALGQNLPTIAIGTPGYMAIEQFNGQPQFNSDLYALGMIAIQALLGLAADELSGLKDTNGHPPGEVKWRHRRSIRSDLADVIDKMVHFDYRQRYQTAAAVLADLAQLGLTYLPGLLVYPPLHNRLTPPAPSTLLAAPAPARATTEVSTPSGSYPSGSYPSGSTPSGSQPSAKDTADPAKATTVVPAAPTQPSPQSSLSQPSAQPSLQPPLQQPPRRSFLGKRMALMGLTTLLFLGGLAGVGYSQKGRVAEYFYNQGRAKSRFGDVKASLDNYNLAIQIHPTYADAYARRCGSYLRLEDDDRSRADCQRAIDLDPDNAIAHLNWGNFYTEQRDLEQANQHYTKAIELSSRELQLQPNNADAYYNRGAARLRLADYPGAIEDTTQAIRLDPQYVEAYIVRCQAQGQLSNHEAAVNDCKQATELNPNHFVAYASLCNNQSNAGQYEQAIVSCTHALQINPNDSYGYNNRGVVYLKLKNYQAAINDYRQAIQRDAKDAVAYHNLGDVLSIQGDQQGAIEAYSNAITHNASFAAAFYGRGLRQAALGNTAAAVADLQQSADLYAQQGRQDRVDDALYQIRVIQGTLTAQDPLPPQESAPPNPPAAESAPTHSVTVIPVVQEPAPALQAPVQPPTNSYVEEPPGYQYNRAPEDATVDNAPLDANPSGSPDPYVQNPPVPYNVPAEPYAEDPPAHYELSPTQPDAIDSNATGQESTPAQSEAAPAQSDSLQVQ